jgi:hypothetical protein
VQRGLLAHYVGDACQPLYSSVHADGLNGARTGVQWNFEELMVDINASNIAKLIDVKLASDKKLPASAKNGAKAAFAILDLCSQLPLQAHDRVGSLYRFVPPNEELSLLFRLRTL